MENERLIREVTAIGNGAHVFAPKEWIGQEVIVIKKPRKTPREIILNEIRDHLPYIEGVYLIGSHARNESEKDSDIDVLIILNKQHKISSDKLQIISLQKDKIEQSIKLAPVLMYSILSEAKAIINEELLKEIKTKHILKKREFKNIISETKEIIKLNKNLLDGEKISYDLKANAYSLVLRARSVYLINVLLKNKKYSNEEFKKYLKNNISIDLDSIYAAYKSVKNNTFEKIKLNPQDLIILSELIEKEVVNFEKKKTS